MSLFSKRHQDPERIQREPTGLLLALLLVVGILIGIAIGAGTASYCKPAKAQAKAVLT